MLNYKGLEAVYEHLTVSEELVDQQIDRLLDQKKTINVTGRPAQQNDEVILDYEGYCDGVLFEGGSATEQPLVLGSGMFIPGFEDQLVGKNIGEMVDVNVTFPVMYHSEKLAGKKATFKCVIREIHEQKKYNADDEFAKEVGGCETFEEFKASIRNTLQTYVDRQAEQELKDHLMNQLIEQVDYEITDEQMEKAIDIEMRELEGQLSQQHLTLDLYCQFMNKTVEQLREDYIPSARKNTLRQMIIAEIAKIENIEATEQDVVDAFAALCQENNLTIEELQPYFDSKMEAALARNVIENRVLDIIKANATITTIEK